MSKRKDPMDMSLPEVETDGPTVQELTAALIRGPATPEAKAALEEVLGGIVLDLD